MKFPKILKRLSSTHDRVICTQRRYVIPRSALHDFCDPISNFQTTTTQSSKISARRSWPASRNDQLPSRKVFNAIFFFNPPHLKIARLQSDEERENRQWPLSLHGVKSNLCCTQLLKTRGWRFSLQNPHSPMCIYIFPNSRWTWIAKKPTFPFLSDHFENWNFTGI